MYVTPQHVSSNHQNSPKRFNAHNMHVHIFILSLLLSFLLWYCSFLNQVGNTVAVIVIYFYIRLYIYIYSYINRLDILKCVRVDCQMIGCVRAHWRQFASFIRKSIAYTEFYMCVRCSCNILSIILSYMNLEWHIIDIAVAVVSAANATICNYRNQDYMPCGRISKSTPACDVHTPWMIII